MTVEYDDIITEQKNSRIMEPAKEEATGIEFYIPHKPVLKSDKQWRLA